MTQTEARQRHTKFLELLALTGNVSHAVKLAGLGRRSVYDRRERDPEFARDWDDALQVSYDAIEHAVRNRAVEGWEEPVFYQGEIVGYIRRYSDENARFLLKAKRPQEFRERVEVSGQVDIAATILERRRRAGIPSDEPS
jgi:hypothetical protein